jgi:hypothetical protein
VSDGTRVLQASEEEKVGIVVECDVLAGLNGLSLDDSKFDNRRRVNRSAIAVGYIYNVSQAINPAWVHEKLSCRVCQSYPWILHHKHGHAQAVGEQRAGTIGCASRE